MNVFLLLLTLLAAGAAPRFTSPKPAAPEYGIGLSASQAQAGWVSLFDGEKTSVSEFGDYELKISTSEAGELRVGKQQKVVRVPAGTSTHRLEGLGRGPIRPGKDLAIAALGIRPLKLKPLLGGEGSTAQWRIIPHASLPADRQATWEELPHRAGLHAVGGPGCVELPGEYGDFVLQLDVHVRRPLSNAGVFFRCKQGEFLNGYEAQVFNGCYDEDPGTPARYATGAIDDRQNARRLVSRDSEPFTMTIVASGPQVATWVNGVQVTDWTDERPKDDNARNGLRLKPGPIQLQAHDRGTDVVFSNIRIAPLD